MDSSEHSQGEPQYQKNFDDMAAQGAIELGPMGSHLWRTDPRHLGFSLARYKFVAKMFHGFSSALEIGCGDGFGAGVIQQEVPIVNGLDFDERFVDAANKQWKHNEGLHFYTCDMLVSDLKPPRRYQGLYSLDVLEHISPEQEDCFLENSLKFMEPDGVAIIGCPSLDSQEHASIWSKQGHVNCKTGYDLKALLDKYFKNTFLFGMNDEVVHTGFHRMCHYNLVLATGPNIEPSQSAH